MVITPEEIKNRDDAYGLIKAVYGAKEESKMFRRGKGCLCPSCHTFLRDEDYPHQETEIMKHGRIIGTRLKPTLGDCPKCGTNVPGVYFRITSLLLGSKIGPASSAQAE